MRTTSKLDGVKSACCPAICRSRYPCGENIVQFSRACGYVWLIEVFEEFPGGSVEHKNCGVFDRNLWPKRTLSGHRKAVG